MDTRSASRAHIFSNLVLSGSHATRLAIMSRLGRRAGFLGVAAAFVSSIVAAQAWVGYPGPRPARARVARCAQLTWKWKDKLGEGTFKEAYMAEVTGKGDYLGFSPGQKLVLKFTKRERYCKGVRITETDVAAHQLAQSYATTFLQKHRPNRGGKPLTIFFPSRKDSCKQPRAVSRQNHEGCQRREHADRTADLWQV